MNNFKPLMNKTEIKDEPHCHFVRIFVISHPDKKELHEQFN
jgi:hypothetical protein